MMDDLISRQAAIDALDGLCDRECEYSKKQRHTMCGACHLGSAFDVIEQLPLLRENLVNNSNHIVNYLANDTISRQAAIDAVRDRMGKGETHIGDTFIECFEMILNALPSAQPEIIRCGKCKHRYTEGENVVYNVCELNHNKVQPDDWFCADAERRTDE